MTKKKEKTKTSHYQQGVQVKKIEPKGNHNRKN